MAALSLCALRIPVVVVKHQNTAAILRKRANRSIKEASSRAICMLYRSCILSKGSASTPNTASNIKAVFSVTGRWPFNISFTAEWLIPIFFARALCEMPLHSISSFNTSPGWVGNAGFRLLAIISGLTPAIVIIMVTSSFSARQVFTTGCSGGQCRFTSQSTATVFRILSKITDSLLSLRAVCIV